MEVDGKLNETEYASCEPCSFEDKAVTADGFCHICEEFLCNSCFQLHLRHKNCRNHVLGPLSQGRGRRQQLVQRRVMCKKHENEHIKYFCRKHDVVICGECIATDHNKCGVEIIRNIAINFQESTQFKDCLQQVSRIEQECSQAKKTLTDNTTNNISSLEQVIDEIKIFKQKLDDFLDSLVKQILTKANESSLEMKETILELQTKINAITLDVSEIKSSFDARQYDDDSLFINLIESKSKIHGLEQSISVVNNTDTVLPLIFEPNQNLKDLFSLDIDFGVLGYTGQTDAAQSRKEASPEHKTCCAVTQTEPKLEATWIVAATQTDPVFAEASASQTDPDIMTMYLHPDPRASGFDVGRRVKYIGKIYHRIHNRRVMYHEYDVSGALVPIEDADGKRVIEDADGKRVKLYRDDKGKITKVEEKGVVHVYWNNTGKTYRHNAGQNGKFDVQLI